MSNELDNLAYDIGELFEMLRYMRPHGSMTESEFVRDFIVEDMPYGIIPKYDGFGNVSVVVGENPTTMWSCHTDTVHKAEGMQGIVFHQDCLIVERDPRDGEQWEPLGADDACGIWIMKNMIRAGIEGLYVFHRGEEKGGLGSDYIINHNPELVNGITHAIAFDRAGDTDIITHQWGGRCCSDEFAYHLASVLTHRNFALDPCDRGVFTDTANYTHLIPECTNVSVGYDDEHTPAEFVDLFYLTSLMDAILVANWKDMPVVKKPDEDWLDDNKWNRTGSTTFNAGYSSTTGRAGRKPVQINKADIWVDADDLWWVYNTAGAKLLIQMLLDIGCTEQDIDNAWDSIAENDWDRFAG